MSNYSSVPLDDEESIQLSNVNSSSAAYLVSSKPQSSSVGNDNPVPITRPPSKGRDKPFIVLFFLHFIVIGLFAFLEKEKNVNPLLRRSKVGNWTSMVMISTILGSFFGSLVIFLISNSESRLLFLSQSIPICIIIQICLANIFFLFGQKLFLLGIIFLISAFYFSFRYKRCKDNLSFTDAIICFVGEISLRYGMWLTLTCAVIIFLHTCILLGWGVFLVNLLANISTKYVSLLLISMFFSLYWITKLFHGIIAHIVGACIVWHFIRDEKDVFEPKKRVLLHLQCAFSTSLGSLCKGSLLSGISEVVLYLHLWSNGLGIFADQNSNPVLLRNTCIKRYCNYKRLVAAIISPFLGFAQKHHRLAFVLTAIYGQTFCKAAQMQLRLYPHTVELTLTDTSHFNLTCIAVETAGIVALFFGLLSFSENQENYTEGTFLMIIYFMAYCGLSLCVEIYKAAIDGIIIAFSAKPERLANEHQIIFLRLLRTSDPSLR